MKSIKHFCQKIKDIITQSREEVVVSLIIVFVGLTSFGLGALSAKESSNNEILIENKGFLSSSALKTVQGGVVNDKSSVSDTKSQNDPSEAKSGEVVASKSGKKYHFPWCPGAKQISAKNKITFSSTEEARKAGYTPASNCEGLE